MKTHNFLVTVQYMPVWEVQLEVEATCAANARRKAAEIFESDPDELARLQGCVVEQPFEVTDVLLQDQSGYTETAK